MQTMLGILFVNFNLHDCCSPVTGDFGELRGSFDLDSVFRFVDQATRFSKRKLLSNVKELPEVVEPVAMPVEEDDFDLSELMGDVMGGNDEDDDNDDDYDNPNERGPARLKKKKKKKGKGKGKGKATKKKDKKKKSKKGKQDL